MSDFSPNKFEKNHSIIMQNRKTLEITGIDNVDSFDDRTISLFIGNSVLIIDGDALNIIRLNIDKGEILIEGQVVSLFYSDGESKKETNMFSRFFKGR